ncbi:MAG: methylated-DNA--[protein]-cysteine S-methyltransferase [Oscillospiraceae bacterium]|nr:methylated-DNA--[protein]-cysteine S-methyltransferase [Oscillospiraceae bacterium]
MRTALYHHTPLGMLVIEEDGAGICRLSREAAVSVRPDVFIGATPLLDAAARQLDEYFAGKRKTFDLPLSLEGTPFQKSVWRALSDIPYGETRAYVDIAEAIGKPKACRAVGMANHANPVMIVVPCHRVVGKDGSLTGYGGGLPMKQFLLDLERKGKR